MLAMKICALIDRSKPRDLFDVNKLKSHRPFLDMERLKKFTVFYMSLDGIFKVDESSFDKIKTINQEDIKKELLPVLPKNSKFDLSLAKDDVIAFLKELLVLNEGEKKYLDEFANGNFDVSLLFDKDFDAERAAKHPMAKWRVANIKK